MIYKKQISLFILLVWQTIDSVDILISYLRMYLAFIVRNLIYSGCENIIPSNFYKFAEVDVTYSSVTV